MCNRTEENLVENGARCDATMCIVLPITNKKWEVIVQRHTRAVLIHK